MNMDIKVLQSEQLYKLYEKLSLNLKLQLLQGKSWNKVSSNIDALTELSLEINRRNYPSDVYSINN